MSRIELAIRNGNYTAEKVIIDGIWTGEYVYIVRVDGSRFQYTERISKSWFDEISRRIKREKERKERATNHLWTNPANVEHTAYMADIMDAYNDYKACMAF